MEVGFYLIDGILYHQSCQHETDDGSDVGNGAVTLVVRVDGFLVLQEFVREYALELALGKLLSFL